MPGSASSDRRDVSVVLAAPAGSARKRYGDYLTAAGCRVAFASTSDAAVAQSLSIQPDVIAISHRLRPLDGARCCAQLKTDARTAAIPVIILTAPTTADGLRAAHDAGCAVLVIQPVSPEDLFRTMRDAVARAKRLVARADRAAARSRSLIARATDARAATPKRDATAGAREFLDALPGCGTEGEYIDNHEGSKNIGTDKAWWIEGDDGTKLPDYLFTPGPLINPPVVIQKVSQTTKGMGVWVNADGMKCIADTIWEADTIEPGTTPLKWKLGYGEASNSDICQ